MNSAKTRICIFFDGYYFKKVNDFYKFTHAMQRRLSFAGLQAYIQNQVAAEAGASGKDCVIIGQHYYIGKLSISEVNPEAAKKELMFQDVLKRSGITAHYRELKTDIEGNKIEKMVDCDLITDALEMAMKGEYDVFVLIAGDSDFVPLVEKIKKYVTTMLVFWDIEETHTRTSAVLINTVDFFAEMKPVIDKRMKTDLEKGLFANEYVPRTESAALSAPPAADAAPYCPPDAGPRSDETWTMGGFKADGAPPTPIEALRMDGEPRELSEEELGRVYASTVISLHPDGRFGYVRGPTHYENRKLNNFQFDPCDVTDYKFASLTCGAPVTFRLKEDIRRTRFCGIPLYKAYEVTLLEPSAAPEA